MGKRKSARKRKKTKCIICGNDGVVQDRSTSVDRETCNRVKVKGEWVKSECEKEKNRRYQKQWRKDNKGRVPCPAAAAKKKSVAISNNGHLTKYAAKKHKRECLKCGEKFTGIGLYNRVCDSCSIENSRAKLLRKG